MSESIFERLARWAVSRGRPIALATVAVLAFAVAGATRVAIDFSSTSFYGGEDRDLDDLERFTETWGADDRDLSVLVTSDDPGGVLTRPHLEAIADLASRLEADPDVVSVVSVPTLRVAPNAPSVLEQAQAIDGVGEGMDARARLLGDPRVVPLLLSEDGSATAVVARLSHSTDDLGPTVTTVGRIRDIVEAKPLTEGLHVELAGIPAIRASFFGLTIRDQMIFVPLTMILVGGVLLYSYRRLHAVIVPGLAAGLPLIVLVGIMGWAGEPIGLLNQAYFTLIPVIAIADGVHLIERTHEELRAGRSPDVAVKNAAGHVGWACLLTSLTTAAGFASLAISDMPILRGFGLYAALGMLLGYASIVFVLPPLLAAVLRRSKSPAAPPAATPKHPRWLVTRRGWVFGVFLIVLGAGAFGARSVVVDNRLSELLESEHPVAEASATVDEELGGILALELDATTDGAWTDSQRTALESITSWAREQPEVRTVVGPQFQGPRARISLRTADIGGRAFGDLRQRVQRQLEAQTPAGVEVRHTGTPAVAYRGINRITDDLRRSLLAVLAIVTVVLGLLLRSVRLALISILPNVFPLVVAYGLVGWSATSLDPLATVILTVALGIAVDDTIHVLARYAAERRAGQSLDDAIVTAAGATGRAVIVTSVTLAVGLLVNRASSFPPLQMLGTLGSAAMLLALIADLGLLPALLATFERQ